MTPAHESWINGMLEGLDKDDIGHLHHLLGKLKISAGPRGTV